MQTELPKNVRKRLIGLIWDLYIPNQTHLTDYQHHLINLYEREILLRKEIPQNACFRRYLKFLFPVIAALDQVKIQIGT